MLCDLFCQAFHESRNIKEVLYFLCSFDLMVEFSWAIQTIVIVSLRYKNISVVTNSRNRDPRCTLLKQ